MEETDGDLSASDSASETEEDMSDTSGGKQLLISKENGLPRTQKETSDSSLGESIVQGRTKLKKASKKAVLSETRIIDGVAIATSVGEEAAITGESTNTSQTNLRVCVDVKQCVGTSSDFE